MYGSQNHFAQSTEIARLKMTEFSSKYQNEYRKKASSKEVMQTLFSMLFLIILSTSVFAGSSQPKLKGGNGGANGRPN
jgi:hypothetical protein